MDECVREMTFEEEYEILKREANKLFESEIDGCETPKANCIVRRALRCIGKLEKEIKLCKEYKELEEKLCVMFAGDCSLSDVVENLERHITEHGKDHPVNARILTYEDADKWNEYRKLEEQGRLLKLQCNVGTEVFAIFPIGDHYEKCQIKKIEIRSTVIGKIRYFIEPTAHLGCSFSYFDDEFEKRVFLTKEEAEAKLKEMEASNIRDE